MKNVLYHFLVPDLEDEVAKLPDKDGWILYTEFMKFAITTELCKIEFQDRVFQKVNYGEEEKKKKKERVRFIEIKDIF